jgi:predicted enzyme related to lactoylglutathione lyase
MSDDRGRFVWYDLMTPDIKAAEAFYTKVAGWGTQPWEGMPYTMWTANGQPMGGVMSNEGTGAPPHWLAYISVPDVEKALAQVGSLGGRTIVPGKDIPTVGRFAIVADPQGAAFALFTPAKGTGRPETDPGMGEFSWHELATTDYAKAWAFYEAVFGWEKRAEHDMGPMGVYLLFGRNGRELGGMYTIMPGTNMPPHWLQYVRVDSADAAAQRVTANGGKVLNGPMEVPGGDRIAQCLDPQGAAFAVHSKSTSA